MSRDIKLLDKKYLLPLLLDKISHLRFDKLFLHPFQTKNEPTGINIVLVYKQIGMVPCTYYWLIHGRYLYGNAGSKLVKLKIIQVDSCNHIAPFETFLYHLYKIWFYEETFTIYPIRTNLLIHWRYLYVDAQVNWFGQSQDSLRQLLSMNCIPICI